MKIEKCNLDFSERSRLVDKNELPGPNCGFGFLKAHKGIRDSKFHLLIGMPSGGKSTLRNSIISRIAQEMNGNILIWLSEESIEDFKTSLAYDLNLPSEMKKVCIYSEMEDVDKFSSCAKSIAEFKKVLIKADPVFILFDNLTTSRVYGVTYAEQTRSAQELKAISINFKIPMFLIAHTKSSVSQSQSFMIDMNDVRGSREIVNLSEFQYVLQSFYVQNSVFTTLRLTKFRNQSPEVKLFVLKYDQNQKKYVGDSEINFTQFKDMYKNSNQL